jgi:hypothetical protein
MTKKDTKNIAHSVRAQLLALARSKGRHNQDVFINYAMERFLYRLSLSPHAANMVLKGALMLHVIEKSFLRATRDIDFLAFFANKKETITRVFKSILETPVPNDGLVFDLENIDIRLTQLDSKEMGAKLYFGLPSVLLDSNLMPILVLAIVLCQNHIGSITPVFLEMSTRKFLGLQPKALLLTNSSPWFLAS